MRITRRRASRQADILALIIPRGSSSTVEFARMALMHRVGQLEQMRNGEAFLGQHQAKWAAT
ncbi:hypothetical protein Trco_001093 [Trichoderma cornu-damae]|uniref:Uncharacterized protein n=1 Tax=Trichoderma cornu-damae TaxID=654480 RepID=A0A9P8QXB0_9HYPO|nr:hypothetical protein Trco_001093 [Trichoderma cornu-damae]